MHIQSPPESVRDVLSVPKSVSDESEAIRLIVSHGKIGDMELTNLLAFFHQYDAATEQDVKVFLEAEKALGTSEKLNLDAAYTILEGIQVGNELRNSRHDLLLSAICWLLGHQVAPDKNIPTGQLHIKDQIAV